MIYIITHKPFQEVVTEKEVYQVLQVGGLQDIDGALRDNTGKEIARKNTSYCELTGLYWIWKNGKEKPEDLTGLLHYRRYFTTRMQSFLYTYFGIKPQVLPLKTVRKALIKNDIILPRRLKAFHSVETIYAAEHIGEDIQLLREIIQEKTPHYSDSFEQVMRGKTYWYANMMILKKSLLDQYCAWLFPILEEMENRIDLSKHEDPYQGRVYGFLAERLLNVWVVHQKLSVAEFPIFNTEQQDETFFKRNYMRLKRILKR